MKLIVGLGNPGAEYENSRHNVGFAAIDMIARRWAIDVQQNKHKALFGKGLFQQEKVMLMKPLTYMNRSGSSVSDAMSFYKIETENLLVIVDDLHLNLGQLRLRNQGTAGGHNGLKDIISWLGTNKYSRLRVGIENSPFGNQVGHVLGNFNAEENDIMQKAYNKVADAAECWLSQGVQAAMNLYNRQDD